MGHKWVGDVDPRLKMARTGMARIALPTRTRKRARMSVTVQVIKYELKQKLRAWDIWAKIVAMSYVFGFRVPSEVFRQWGKPLAESAPLSNYGHVPMDHMM